MRGPPQKPRYRRVMSIGENYPNFGRSELENLAVYANRWGGTDELVSVSISIYNPKPVQNLHSVMDSVKSTRVIIVMTASASYIT